MRIWPWNQLRQLKRLKEQNDYIQGQLSWGMSQLSASLLKALSDLDWIAQAGSVKRK